MFSLQIIDSDAFLNMPATSQLLYFHLGMRADDDGFINNTKTIMKMCSVNDDDLAILIQKGFIIPFKDYIVVIKHWNINNYIQRDRYTETKYLEDKYSLFIKDDKSYTLDATQGVSLRFSGDLLVDENREVSKNLIANFKKK